MEEGTANQEGMPIIFYTCHICAIEVPAAFASEHVASMKHQANVRIAKEATQRTRALISALPPPNQSLNARFCAHCSTIVSTKHDNTNKHRNAVLQDKMLRALMTAYVGDNDTDDHLDHNEDMIIGSQENEDTERDDGAIINGETKINKITQAEMTDINQVINVVNNNITDIKIENNENTENTLKGSINENNEDDKSIDGLDINYSKGDETCKQIDEITQPKVAEINDQAINIINNAITAIEIENNDHIENSSRLRYTIDECNTIRENMERRASETRGRAVSGDTSEVNLKFNDFVPHNNKFIKVVSDHYHNFVGEGGAMKCVECSDSFVCEDSLWRAFSLRHLVPKTVSLVDEQDVKKLDVIYSYCYICNHVVTNDKSNEHIRTLHHQMNKVKREEEHSKEIANYKNENLTIDANVESNKTHVKKEATHKVIVKNIYKEEVTLRNDKYSFCNICNQVIKNDNLDRHKLTRHHRMKKEESSGNSLNQVATANVDEKRIHQNVQNPQAANTKEKHKNVEKFQKLIDDVFLNYTPEDHDASDDVDDASEREPNNTIDSMRKAEVFKLLKEHFKYNTPVETGGNIAGTSTSNANARKLIQNNNEKKRTRTRPKKVKPGENSGTTPFGNCQLPKGQAVKHSKNGKSAITVNPNNPYVRTIDKSVRCSVCDLWVPDTPQNRQDHLGGTKHAANVEKKKQSLL